MPTAIAVATTYSAARRSANFACSDLSGTAFMCCFRSAGTRRRVLYGCRRLHLHRAACVEDDARGPELYLTRAHRPARTAFLLKQSLARHDQGDASGALEWRFRGAAKPMECHQC